MLTKKEKKEYVFKKLDEINGVKVGLTEEEKDLRSQLENILEEIVSLKLDAEDNVEAYEEILTQDFAEEEY